MYEAAACAAECVGCTYHEGEADLLCSFFAFEERVRGERWRCADAELDHPLAVCLAVFGLLYRFEICAEYADIIFLPDAEFVGLHAEVEGCLSAHGGEDGIYLFGLQYVYHGLDIDRHEVDVIGDHGVGHDGRGIGVEQGDFDTLFAQAAGSLGAGVVKFTCLSDNDGA